MAATTKISIQEMSLMAIRVDHALQSRVETRTDVVKDYADALLAGALFPAIIVFFDGKIYWVADGFHRVAAYKHANRVSIPAEVKEGTRRDAILYSAGANAKMGQRPTAEDKKKSVFMLLDDPEWFRWSDNLIAKHCGVSSTTANRLRAEYCLEKNIPIPKKVLFFSGTTGEPIQQSYKKTPHKITEKASEKGKKTYSAKIDGKKTHLGTTREAAENKLRLLMLERLKIESILTDRGRLTQILNGAGIVASAANRPGGHPTGVVGDGFVCVNMPDFHPPTIYQAVGNALILQQIVNPIARMIVVCLPGEPPVSAKKLMDAAEKFGIEYLTPLQLVSGTGASIPDISQAPLEGSIAVSGTVDSSVPDYNQWKAFVTRSDPANGEAKGSAKVTTIGTPETSQSFEGSIPKKFEIKDYYSTGEIARLCCMAARTVSKWIDSGLLKGERTKDSVNQYRRVRHEDLAAFLEANGLNFALEMILPGETNSSDG